MHAARDAPARLGDVSVTSSRASSRAVVRLRTQFTATRDPGPRAFSTAVPYTLQPPLERAITRVGARRTRAAVCHSAGSTDVRCYAYGGRRRWAPSAPGLLIAAYSIHLCMRAIPNGSRRPGEVGEVHDVGSSGQDACLWSSTPVASRREADSEWHACIYGALVRAGACAPPALRSILCTD